MAEQEDTEDWIEKIVSHPCESALNIESGSTSIIIPTPRDTQLVDSPMYDEKDKEIEQSFQDIYDASMDTFDQLQEEMQGIEGKYKARNSEVAVMFLNSALAAANAKLKQKDNKDKTKNAPSKITGDSTVTNNTQINITTAELIKMMTSNRSPINNTIDIPIAYGEDDSEDEIVDAIEQVLEVVEEIVEVAPINHKRLKMQRKIDDDAQ